MQIQTSTDTDNNLFTKFIDLLGIFMLNLVSIVFIWSDGQTTFYWSQEEIEQTFNG